MRGLRRRGRRRAESRERECVWFLEIEKYLFFWERNDQIERFLERIPSRNSLPL
jgi:hypothetical protein